MTLSPKTLTSMAPRALSTSRVTISRIALDLALTSIAQIPRTTGAFGVSVPVDSEGVLSVIEPIDEGDDDRPAAEAERRPGDEAERK